MSRTVSRTGGRVTTNHDRIRQWADVRDATPATAGPSEDAPLRFSFTETDPYVAVSWETFFERFERETLAFVYEPVEDEGWSPAAADERTGEDVAGESGQVDASGASRSKGSVRGTGSRFFYKFVDRDTV